MTSLRSRRAGALRRLIVLGTVALTLGATVACTLVPSRGPREVVIGAVNPLTGSLAAQGKAVNDGIQYAVEEFNAGQGAQGYQLRLETRDDESRPERATAAAEELIKGSGAVALVGGYVDTLVGAISEVAERNQVPYVAASSLDERLTARGYRYFFRVSKLESFTASTVGVLRDLIRPSRVAILHSATPGSTQLAQRQREALEASNIQVVVVESFSPGATDFTPALAKAKALGAEALVVNGFLADNILALRQSREQGLGLKAFLGSFGMEFPALIAELGPLAEGSLGTTAWEPGVAAPGQEEASRQYVEGFRQRFGRDPDPLSMHGYAAARAVIEAIVQASRGGAAPEPAAVRDALTRLDLQLPMGRLRFDERGDPVEYQRVIFQIQNGQHVVVYPLDRATGRLQTLPSAVAR